MPQTNLLGPTSNLTPGGFTAWGQPTRVYRTSTGASAAFAVASGVRTTWFNCFDANQIPVGATIDGVEVVFSGNAGTAGSTGIGEGAQLDYRVYNGSSYSAVLATTYHEGANDYQNITIGGASDLHGLSWSESDQANFGFDVEVVAITATPVVIVSRHVPMRVYYTEAGGGPTGSTLGFAQLSGVDSDNIGQVSTVPVTKIGSISGVEA